MTNEISKKERQHMLKKLLLEGEISDQLHLLLELQKLGIETTQATISRDLQEIGIVKVRTKTGFKYTILEHLPKNYLLDQLRVLVGNFVYAINSTGNLLIIKTSPGNANGVASLIDRIEFKGVLGTVAGDDTILVIADTAKNRQDLQSNLDRLLSEVTPNVNQ